MSRTVRYLSWIVWQYLLVILGFGAVLVAFQALITPLSEYEHAAGRITGMAFAAALLYPTLLQFSLIPIYLPLSLSMSVTRRGFFRGAQVAKLQMTLGIAAIFEMIQIAAEKIFGVPALFYGGSLASVCMMILLSAVLGETLGLVGMRFGRKGLLAVCILIGVVSGLLGGAFGYFIASGSLNSEMAGWLADMMAVLTDARLLCAVLLAVSALLTGLNALLCRRFSVE